MRRRTLGYYQQHPRQFEQDRAAWDERELARFEAEQDELEERADRWQGWQMRTDLAGGGIASERPGDGSARASHADAPSPAEADPFVSLEQPRSSNNQASEEAA